MSLQYFLITGDVNSISHITHYLCICSSTSVSLCSHITKLHNRLNSFRVAQDIENRQRVVGNSLIWGRNIVKVNHAILEDPVTHIQSQLQFLFKSQIQVLSGIMHQCLAIVDGDGRVGLFNGLGNLMAQGVDQCRCKMLEFRARQRRVVSQQLPDLEIVALHHISLQVDGKQQVLVSLHVDKRRVIDGLQLEMELGDMAL
ncbi:hypothetical protein EJF18_50663 [Clavispora lusitaniae]|uniref:Uncharacterized protein n=1 Tax=Clavispora lusitaniae TaxID=36911 RepID=A0ACD0WQL1_CLALS|nr:hypothetical protein EJF14_50663 [Clavispora lusitaniae]QFZ35086.1 hypothetical protein EJF16_50663 [Clavispora lusitaniae]QFZ40771.1 hypothetical protein EJF15_50663 [Clavispora lusitaniae]QFZ46451.1 hypothetical protein EJF18_50663 [Clavispora lusitaniae]QFZ52113.1 hypothetical protein EJF17_50663 [Clavispora lusitaniae]